MLAAHVVAGPGDAALRAAFGRFATGVALVTAEVGGSSHGLIVSTFTAVSLEPPLVSFCPGRGSLTWRRMRQAGRFDIHVLGARHAAFARRAAEPGANRFAEPSVLHHAVALIECDLEAEHPAGDHSIVVGHVRDVRVSPDSEPLVYFDGGFGAFNPTEKEHPWP
jgi:3-hydroxy-9,10-secoandrosta-1,3,5(10)-triene-9,17-dione monooxygenase reductase component